MSCPTKNNDLIMNGYTIIELMVALVVTAIVLAGSLVGFNVIEKQFHDLNLRTSMDRQAVVWIRELQKDIGMAGYKLYQGATSMSKEEAIIFDLAPFDDGANPLQIVQGGFWVTYDALDDTDAMYRKAARYTCTRAAGFTTSQCTKVVAKCTTSPCLVWDPGTTVTLASAATKFSENKAIVLNVKEFSIARVNQKVLPDTIFNDAYQVLRFKLVLSSTDKSNLINVAVEKTYHFSIRAMNISMVRNYD